MQNKWYATYDSGKQAIVHPGCFPTLSSGQHSQLQSAMTIFLFCIHGTTVNYSTQKYSLRRLSIWSFWSSLSLNVFSILLWRFSLQLCYNQEGCLITAVYRDLPLRTPLHRISVIYYLSSWFQYLVFNSSPPAPTRLQYRHVSQCLCRYWVLCTCWTNRNLRVYYSLRDE